MLYFYFDIVLRTHYLIDEIDIQFENSGDKIVNGLLPVPIIHQTCLKTEIALLIQGRIVKLFAYDKVVISNANRI